MPTPPTISFDHEDASAQRILRAAQEHLFAHGYQSLTMDDLAHEVGMSKKTLYVHFPGKDALIGRIIDALGRTMRGRLEAVLADPHLSFPQRVAAVVEVIGSMLSRVNPTMLRELQRYAPAIYAKIDDLRQKNIPYVFGRLLQEGIAAGKVRREIDPGFAAEFWLQAIRGLIHPLTLERTQLTPRQTLEKALNLFLAGLLTPAGRKDYEKLFPS